MACLTASSTAALANRWQASLTDDGVYVAGSVRYQGLGLALTCHAQSRGGGSVIDSIWFESTIAEPEFFLLSISRDLVPQVAFERSDLTLFVGQTGYRLPTIQWNEMVGDWELKLPASDQMFSALAQAQRLVLQVGSTQAWELPVPGLAEAVGAAYQHCAAGWAGLAPATAPAAPVASPNLRRIADPYIATACSDYFTPGPQAYLEGDIDGDGLADLVVNYNDITCNAEARRPDFCGASLCSVDVYLTRTIGLTGRPENLLGMSASLVTLNNGNMALATTGNLSMCQNNPACIFYWYWDGSQFTTLAQ